MTRQQKTLLSSRSIRQDQLTLGLVHFRKKTLFQVIFQTQLEFLTEIFANKIENKF